MTTKKAKNAPEPEVIFDPEDLLFSDWSGQVTDLLESGGEFKYIQWSNREGGKWEFPVADWVGTPLVEDFGPVVEVEHGHKEIVKESVVLLNEITMSVVAGREAWAKEIDDERVYFPTYEPGCSMRYYFLVMLKEWEEIEPCIITVGGHTGQALKQAINSYKTSVTNFAAQATSGKEFPSWFFWGTYQAGESKWVGRVDKAKIFPPVAIVPDTDDKYALLNDLYIGHEMRDFILAELERDYKPWSEKWSPENLLMLNGGNGNGNGNGNGDILLTANILPGGEIERVDLSLYKHGKWMRFAVSTGLFETEGDASNAYKQLFNSVKVRSGCKTDADRWWAWYDYLNELSQAQAEADEAQAARA
ncbi:MAG: hypothetical protein V3R81_15400 [Gammaproteobacteria bacterium]